jgi:hypothetical protein
MRCCGFSSISTDLPIGVVFEAIFQAFGETQFAARIEAGGTESGD